MGVHRLSYLGFLKSTTEGLQEVATHGTLLSVASIILLHLTPAFTKAPNKVMVPSLGSQNALYQNTYVTNTCLRLNSEHFPRASTSISGPSPPPPELYE